MFLSKKLKKHIVEVRLSARYRNDAEFALRCTRKSYRKLFCNMIWKHLKRYLSYSWLVWGYLYLERRRNRRRAPLHPPNVWNLYLWIINNKDLTNNLVETVHRRLQHELRTLQYMEVHWKDGKNAKKNRYYLYQQLFFTIKAKKNYRQADTD